jgi:hypothetical protein
VAEILGLEVDWFGDVGIASFSNDEIIVYIERGSSTAHVIILATGTELVHNMGAPAFMFEDRIYAPLRFLAEQVFEATVDYNNITRMVTITP